MTAEAQSWLTVLGLALDFFGFVLLLREWWIAFLSERALMAHEEMLERQQKLRAFAAQNTSDSMRQHLTRAGEMQDDMAIRSARDERRSAQGAPALVHRSDNSDCARFCISAGGCAAAVIFAFLAACVLPKRYARRDFDCIRQNAADAETGLG